MSSVDCTLLTTVCPACGEAHPLARSIHPDSGDRPGNGDVSLCFDCGEVSIFDDRKPGGVRRPTRKEAKEIACNRDIQAALAAWHAQHERLQ
jgi:hypothetical protein